MKGRIYKVTLDGEVYVGSTTRTVNARQAEHNYSLKKGAKSKFYEHHRTKNEKVRCVWVCDVEYQSLDELRAAEEEYRKKLNAKLNSQRAYKTQQDGVDDEKKRNRDWPREYQKEKFRRKVRLSLIKSYFNTWCNTKSTELSNIDKNAECVQQSMDNIKPKRPRIVCDVCKCIVEKSHIRRHKNTLKCSKIKSC